MEMLEIKDEGLQKLISKGYPPAVAYGHFCEGKYSKAVDLCLEILDKDPRMISARLILARSYFHAGQYDRAEEHFRHVMRHDAVNLAALRYLGDILYRDGNEAGAMTYYRKVLELDSCCHGLHSPIEREETDTTRSLTITRPGEEITVERHGPLAEPAFITETVGDIYREQGYFALAGEVYRRLLVGGHNDRVADKLKAVEEKLDKKDKG